MDDIIQTDSGIHAFTFGDPESVLDRSDILDYLISWSNNKWYEPPISFDGLSKSLRASTHHSSALYVKRNIISGTFRPHKLLSRDDFSAIVLDYLVFGNCYLELRKSRTGDPFKLTRSLAKYTRRGIDLDDYYFVHPNMITHANDGEHKFKRGSIYHLLEADTNQEIYGLPEYLSALSSAWLNESATLFRRRYYKNGSHAGYIMYLTDPSHDSGDIEALRKAVKSSKGPGNFRNLFMYAPSGKKDGLQVIPLSEVAAKDEFFNIKNVTRDDILSAHRVPPQLMGVMPNTTGGFGSVTDAAKVFNINEIQPLQAKFKGLNEWIGEEVVKFEDYALAIPPVAEKIL